MGRRYPHAARDRDERAHGVVQDAIDKGYTDTGRPYPIAGMPDHDTARAAQQSVMRALAHFGFPTAAWVTDNDGNQCGRDCQAPGTPHGVAFELHSKDAARRYVVRQTGGDPSKLKFNPYEQRRPRR